MALLDSAIARCRNQYSEVSGMVLGPWLDEFILALRKEFGDDIWALYRKHENDKVPVKVPVIGIRISVRLNQIPFIHWFVEQAAGPEPEKAV